MSQSTHVQKSHPDRLSSRRSILYLILILALVRGFIYAAIVPPWQAPDEPAQFERVKAALTTEDWRSTAENGPEWYDELRDSLLTFQFLNYQLSRATNIPDAPLNHYLDLYREAYGGLYANRPVYAAIGLPLFLTQNQDITLQLYLVRLGTVLMGVAIILFAYLTVRTIFPKNNFLILGVPILILFNPQHTHILSTVNNGNLAELLVTVTLYFVTRGLMRGFSLLNILAIASFSLVAILTKATAYFLLLPIGSIGLFYLWEYRRYWRWLLLASIPLVGLIYYFTPARLKALIFEAGGRLTMGQFYLDPFVPQRIFGSFWAMPGWAILRLNPFWYQLLLVVCSLALGGLFILLVIRRRLFFSKQFQPQRRALLVLGIAAGTAIAIQVGWHIITGTLLYSQGRSIYPVIMPISVFLMFGWQQLIPAAWQKPGLLALTTAFFLFDSMVLFDYIIPFFYSRY